MVFNDQFNPCDRYQAWCRKLFLLIIAPVDRGGQVLIDDNKEINLAQRPRLPLGDWLRSPLVKGWVRKGC